MTYNMGHYDWGVGVGIPDNVYQEKLDNYKAFFANNPVDLFGIQEWYQYIDQNNQHNSNTTLFDDYFQYNGGNTNIWCALKGQFPMFNLETGTIGNRLYVGAKVLSKKGVIQLLSVHFTPGANNASTRISEAQELIQMLNGVQRYVVFGDFNPEPNEEDTLFGLFTAQGMHIANCGDFGKIVTYHNNPSYIIDNIITSSNITITNAYSLDVYSELSSDHLPLFAKLKIN